MLKTEGASNNVARDCIRTQFSFFTAIFKRDGTDAYYGLIVDLYSGEQYSFRVGSVSNHRYEFFYRSYCLMAISLSVFIIINISILRDFHQVNQKSQVVCAPYVCLLTI